MSNKTLKEVKPSQSSLPRQVMVEIFRLNLKNADVSDHSINPFDTPVLKRTKSLNLKSVKKAGISDFRRKQLKLVRFRDDAGGEFDVEEDFDKENLSLDIIETPVESSSLYSDFNNSQAKENSVLEEPSAVESFEHSSVIHEEEQVDTENEGEIETQNSMERIYKSGGDQGSENDSEDENESIKTVEQLDILSTEVEPNMVVKNDRCLSASDEMVTQLIERLSLQQNDELQAAEDEPGRLLALLMAASKQLKKRDEETQALELELENCRMQLSQYSEVGLWVRDLYNVHPLSQLSTGTERISPQQVLQGLNILVEMLFDARWSKYPGKDQDHEIEQGLKNIDPEQLEGWKSSCRDMIRKMYQLSTQVDIDDQRIFDGESPVDESEFAKNNEMIESFDNVDDEGNDIGRRNKEPNEVIVSKTQDQNLFDDIRDSITNGNDLLTSLEALVNQSAIKNSSDISRYFEEVNQMFLIIYNQYKELSCSNACITESVTSVAQSMKNQTTVSNIIITLQEDKSMLHELLGQLLLLSFNSLLPFMKAEAKIYFEQLFEQFLTYKNGSELSTHVIVRLIQLIAGCLSDLTTQYDANEKWIEKELNHKDQNYGNMLKQLVSLLEQKFNPQQ